MRLPRLPDGILHHLTLRCRFYVAVQGGNKGNQEINNYGHNNNDFVRHRLARPGPEGREAT